MYSGDDSTDEPPQEDADKEQDVSLSSAVESMQIKQSSTNNREYRHLTAIPAATNGIYAGTMPPVLLPSKSQPATMSLSELGEHCMGEIAKYHRGERSNDQYALEIFRRAMLQQDQRAWELLQQRFHHMMVSWLRRHPRSELALRLDSEENYVAQAFSRFWITTVRNPLLEFSTLAAALDYLRAALNSVIMDTLRAQMRAKEVPLPELGYPGPAPVASDEDSGLWETLKSLLPNLREQRLAYLLFHDGLKPREIVQFCPNEFTDVHEIYRLRRNIMDRLLRSRERIRWLLGLGRQE